MIRLATVDDIPELFRLCVQCHEEYGHNPPMSEAKSKDLLYDYIASDHTERVVFVSQSKDITGLLMGVITPAFYSFHRQAYELVWWVRPEFRRSRDAIRLFLAYELWAEKMGAFSINTSSVNDWNSLDRLYLSRGYRKTEQSYRKVIHGS